MPCDASDARVSGGPTIKKRRNFRWESEAHVYILFRDHQLVSVGYLAATSSITRQQGVEKSNTNQDQDVLNPLKRECK